MNENQLLDWAWRTIEGDINQEAKILKIALCQSYQQQYTDLKTMCHNAGLSDYQAELVRKWKQNGTRIETDIFYTLYNHLVFKERERYLKALHNYYKNTILS